MVAGDLGSSLRQQHPARTFKVLAAPACPSLCILCICCTRACCVHMVPTSSTLSSVPWHADLSRAVVTEPMYYITPGGCSTPNRASCCAQAVLSCCHVELSLCGRISLLAVSVRYNRICCFDLYLHMRRMVGHLGCLFRCAYLSMSIRDHHTASIPAAAVYPSRVGNCYPCVPVAWWCSSRITMASIRPADQNFGFGGRGR